MTITLGLNFGQFTTNTLTSFAVSTALLEDGFQTLTLATTNSVNETKSLNIYKDGLDPKVSVNGNVYNFQEGVQISLMDDWADSSLMAISTDGNPCALRLSSVEASTPRVIFSGVTSGSVSNNSRVAYLSYAFNVFNEFNNLSITFHQLN